MVVTSRCVFTQQLSWRWVPYIRFVNYLGNSQTKDKTELSWGEINRKEWLLHGSVIARRQSNQNTVLQCTPTVFKNRNGPISSSAWEKFAYMYKQMFSIFTCHFYHEPTIILIPIWYQLVKWMLEFNSPSLQSMLDTVLHMTWYVG